MSVKNYHKQQKKHHLDTKKIRHLMIDREITNADLAKTLHTTAVTVSRLISGARRNPHFQHALARVLGVRLHEILENPEAKSATNNPGDHQAAA